MAQVYRSCHEIQLFEAKPEEEEEKLEEDEEEEDGMSCLQLSSLVQFSSPKFVPRSVQSSQR